MQIEWRYFGAPLYINAQSGGRESAMNWKRSDVEFDDDYCSTIQALKLELSSDIAHFLCCSIEFK